jgi:hypothetical protein
LANLGWISIPAVSGRLLDVRCRDDEFKGGFVRFFANEVRIGDAVLLRTRISKIHALGMVASECMLRMKRP